MSVVFGLCGTNFYSFIADGRLVVGDYPDLLIVSKKVYKINDRVLLGGAGWFQGDKEITSLQESFSDANEITPNTAVEAAISYIEKQKNKITTTRNFLVGGKNEDGGFGIYEIQYDAAKQNLMDIPRIP